MFICFCMNNRRRRENCCKFQIIAGIKSIEDKYIMLQDNQKTKTLFLVLIIVSDIKKKRFVI